MRQSIVQSFGYFSMVLAHRATPDCPAASGQDQHSANPIHRHGVIRQLVPTPVAML